MTNNALNKTTCTAATYEIVGNKVNLTHDDGTTETVSMKIFKRDYETPDADQDETENDPTELQAADAISEPEEELVGDPVSQEEVEIASAAAMESMNLPTDATPDEILARAVEMIEKADEVSAVIEQAETAAPVAVTPVEEEVTLADLKTSTKGEKKGGKQPDPNSGRQAILKVMFASGIPMTPSMINTVLKAQGREIKYISSHLNYFKSHAQIIHLEGGSTYILAQKTHDRLAKDAATLQLATV
jgi:hypothetical protein